ncbi:uncharacterized protein BHQ10_010302 [Talaromyces amestolkiae]|uniref:Knr4/Smi1-like domain-containing protein n=1 Tax=Talaromyces amestolkiae TaxID=1196081 RepID=A0A364LEP4_TALAM|nr:uncharacterized protein BHQ10_010302 [Talaromyces amestolkiae]RAO74290.1 hypothetical protein BHQ10_010302 [Talaromyces amestolkiae]
MRSSLGPEEVIDITRNVTEADFENLNSLVKKTLESADPHLNAMTGASFILTVTKKRLEEELVMPGDEYKDKSFQQMLDELDWNTLRFPEMWEDYSNGDESTLPRTILRAPARADENARVESKLGCTLPDDLKKFYALTNGTQPVISGPHFYRLNNPILSVFELHWENFSWMGGYEFDLFPETSLPVHIVRLTIEGRGGSRCTSITGRGQYALEEAYQKAGELEKKVINKQMKRYHGSWDKLRDLRSCWYQQAWGDAPMGLFHSFRDFLSLVVFESRYEEDKSPLNLP